MAPRYRVVVLPCGSRHLCRQSGVDVSELWVDAHKGCRGDLPLLVRCPALKRRCSTSPLLYAAKLRVVNVGYSQYYVICVVDIVSK
eukprot:6194839-Pleurochrysis_carterae.AAC.3